jgi:peroxiredoxin
VSAPTSSVRPVAGKIGVTLLCCYLVAVALRIDGCYHPDARPHDDVPTAGPQPGERFPAFDLPDLSGARITLKDLAGRPAVLAFVPSLDWSPPTKARVLDLAAAVDGRHDLTLALLLTAAAATPRSLVFVREHRLPAYVLVDGDGLTERLGLQVPGPDGTPIALPATFVLDPQGTVLLRDVRRDTRVWLAPQTILAATRLSAAP